MKIKLLFIILMSTSAAIAANVRVTGPSVCVHNRAYAYEADAKPDKSDKGKGDLIEKVYEWHIVGSAIGKIISASTSRATIQTIEIPGGVFPDDPRLWPKATVVCTVRFIWKNARQTQATSETIDVTVAPQGPTPPKPPTQ